MNRLKCAALCGILLGTPMLATAQVIELGRSSSAVGNRSLQSRYQSYEQQAAAYSELPVKSIDEVVRLKVSDARLTLDTPALGDADVRSVRQFRVKLPEFPGPTMVRSYSYAVGGVGAAGGQNRVRSYTFTSYEMPDPDTLVTWTVQQSTSMLRIDRVTQNARGSSSVQLRQSRSETAKMRGIVEPTDATLHVDGDVDGDGVNEALDIQAKDFETLLRDNPKAMDTYARPLLERLGQEHLFAPDLGAAWQVLNEYWPTDSKVLAAVKELLPNLNASSFREREAAMKSLMDLGRPGAAALLRLDRNTLTPEQRLQIERALTVYQRLPEDVAEKLRNDKRFMLDALLADDADIRLAALKQLKKLTKRDTLPVDPQADIAVRYPAVRTLRKELVGSGRATTRPATAPSTRPSTAG